MLTLDQVSKAINLHLATSHMEVSLVGDFDIAEVCLLFPNEAPDNLAVSLYVQPNTTESIVGSVFFDTFAGTSLEFSVVCIPYVSMCASCSLVID